MCRRTTGSDDNRDNHQSEKAKNLDGTSSHFDIAIPPHIDQITSQNECETDCDDDRRGDVRPERNDDSCGGDLRRNGDRVAVAVGKSEREAYRWVDETCSPMWERAGGGEL